MWKECIYFIYSFALESEEKKKFSRSEQLAKEKHHHFV
jgi:hypothetical protein